MTSLLIRSNTIPGADSNSNGGSISRKGSFVSMKRSSSLNATQKSTVSQKGFVFQGAGGGGAGSESQSSMSNAWGEYSRSHGQGTTTNAIGGGVTMSSIASISSSLARGEKRPAVSLSTALWTSIAANKFKKGKQ